MLKTAYGLSGKNLNLNVDSLLQQIDDLKEEPEALEVNYRSHPLMPLRLKVMQMFAESPIFKQIVEEISETGNDNHKAFVVARLADIAIADGKLRKTKQAVQ